MGLFTSRAVAQQGQSATCRPAWCHGDVPSLVLLLLAQSPTQTFLDSPAAVATRALVAGLDETARTGQPLVLEAALTGTTERPLVLTVRAFELDAGVKLELVRREEGIGDSGPATTETTLYAAGGRLRFWLETSHLESDFGPGSGSLRRWFDATGAPLWELRESKVVGEPRATRTSGPKHSTESVARCDELAALGNSTDAVAVRVRACTLLGQPVPPPLDLPQPTLAETFTLGPRSATDAEKAWARFFAGEVDLDAGPTPRLEPLFEADRWTVTARDAHFVAERHCDGRRLLERWVERRDGAHFELRVVTSPAGELVSVTRWNGTRRFESRWSSSGNLGERLDEQRNPPAFRLTEQGAARRPPDAAKLRVVVNTLLGERSCGRPQRKR